MKTRVKTIAIAASAAVVATAAAVVSAAPDMLAVGVWFG